MPVRNDSEELRVMFTCTGRMPQALAARMKCSDFRNLRHILMQKPLLALATWLMEYEALDLY